MSAFPGRAACLVLALLAPGCVDDVAPEPVAFELAEELRLGSVGEPGPTLFGDVTSIEVGGDGSLYVLDSRAFEVRVFDRDGAHLRSFGREGSGPGEWLNPAALRWGPDGHLWVVDLGNDRYSVYTAEGAHVADRRRPLLSYMMPWHGGFDVGGRLWDSFNLFTGDRAELLGLVRLDDDLSPVDTLVVGPVESDYFENPQGTSRAHIPFTPYLLFAFDPSGGYWVGDATAYRLRRISRAGDTLASIEHPYEPVPVEREELDEALEDLERFRLRGWTLDPTRMPGVKPAFGAFFLDDEGRVWVVRHQPGDALELPMPSTRLDVFDPTGTFLGRAVAPMGLELYDPHPIVRDGRLYGVATDDLGVEHVVVVRVRRARG